MHSFMHSCMHACIHSFIDSLNGSSQLDSTQPNSIQSNSSSSMHSFQFTSFQLTNSSYKQTGSYGHVLFLKLPPRRVPDTTWYSMNDSQIAIIVSMIASVIAILLDSSLPFLSPWCSGMPPWPAALAALVAPARCPRRPRPFWRA